ncbi:UNVERIFIED_CONTAM: hypothetical protein PYX00_007167 [Menopon gallinae]|uniref:E3 ubiquitin-protein ligase RBBP6 n=1 Tax=Menopon gallinae TaxID=328185 RepID=A0AAW2HIR9_9NEOP
MSVHYKFKSALDYDTVTFDGLHISVKDLKKAILQQKKIGKTIDFDLQITNAQTKETYTNDDALISKNASLIVARVPLTQQQKKQWENNKQTAALRTNDSSEQSSLSQVDISSLDLSEEDKIKTMMSQSTSDYDPSNYVKVRGSNQVGTVPASYICFKCHQRGHWIKDCPNDGTNMATETVKKSTGIPRSFMIEVEGPQVPGARMTPSGVYAVPAIDHEVYKEKKIEKPPFLPDKPPKATTIPEDLICGICKDLLQDAVMVPCCGISFCDECIRNYLVDSDESECPDCNEKDVSPDTLIPNRFLRNNVNTFKNETGYIKVKPQIIHQRVPTPPRPSLPDFVPPPEYVDSTTPAETQPSANSPYRDSPSSQIHPSPCQVQSTPVFSECGDSSNPADSPKLTSPNVDPHDEYHQTRRSGVLSGLNRNTRYPAPRYTSTVSEPTTSVSFPPLRRTQGHNGIGYQTDKTPQVMETLPIPAVEQKTPDVATPDAESKDKSAPEDEKADKDKPAEDKEKKVKKSDMEVDDVSSVSSNTSEEPPPPAESRRAEEGQKDPSQCPSYAIPSLFSGLHPVSLPPPGSERYPPPRPAEAFIGSQSDSGEERSSTPTVDERMEIPPLRAPYDPYRQPGYGMPYYDQHYSVPPSYPMPYDPNAMYDRSYRGFPRGPRPYRGRYAMRQPPPPGSRPITPPRNEEEAYLAFQRMLKEKEERDKRKNEKLKSSRRSTSRSRSRSAGRSRRSFSGARSRSRTRSRTPARRTRSRSKKRSHTRSRSFVISRSRSRSYSRSPLHERNYSPKKYSPHRSPLRYDRFDYGHWNQDYRRGGYRSRGRKRFYNKSPPRGHDQPPYNRYLSFTFHFYLFETYLRSIVISLALSSLANRVGIG